jgi:hypothetical protein
LFIVSVMPFLKRYYSPLPTSLKSAYPPAPPVRRNLHMLESGTGQQRRQAGSGSLYLLFVIGYMLFVGTASSRENDSNNK